MIGMAVFSLTTLINPGKLNSEETRTNSSVQTVPEPSTELELPKITEQSEKSTLPIISLIILLLVCSGSSLLATFVLKYLVTVKSKNKQIKSKKRVQNSYVFSAKKRAKNLIKKEFLNSKRPPNSEPIVTVISPEESTPVEKRSPTLVETLDLRKRRSLMSIMQDN
jgi:hypothetical protein